MTAPDRLIYHSLVSKHATLAMDVEVARKAGFDGIEASGGKIAAFLDAGFTRDELRQCLEGLDVPGVGFLIDIERQGDDRVALMREAEELFRLASAAGADAVQVITGPLDVEVARRPAAPETARLYRGLVGLPAQEQVDRTASNLAELADRAADHGLLVYLEGLSWTPLNTLDLQLDVIRKAGRNNLRLLVDFWHCYTAGVNPERISKLDPEILYGVHICDSLEFGGGVPDEAVLRDVPTGSGVLDLREWVDAVKSTGYRGWWSCELFCRKQHQSNSHAVAGELFALMHSLVVTR